MLKAFSCLIPDLLLYLSTYLPLSPPLFTYLMLTPMQSSYWRTHSTHNGGKVNKHVELAAHSSSDCQLSQIDICTDYVTCMVNSCFSGGMVDQDWILSDVAKIAIVIYFNLQLFYQDVAVKCTYSKYMYMINIRNKESAISILLKSNMIKWKGWARHNVKKTIPISKSIHAIAI